MDYGRLWELIQPTDEERDNADTVAISSSGILYRCRFGEKGEQVSAWHELPKAATRWTREGFVADCKKYRREFIDPASQQGGDELWRSTDLLRDALKRMKPGGGLYRSIEEQIEENEKRMGSES